MKTPTLANPLRNASGEELLLMAIFGQRQLKPSIDRELDRRATLRTNPMRIFRPVRRAA